MWLTVVMDSLALAYRSFGARLESLDLDAARKSPRQAGQVRVKMIQVPIDPSEQRGAREVVGIYRSEARVPRLRSLGITPLAATGEDEIIRYARTADITFDALGGPLASKVLENMRGDTRFVGYGLLTGVPVRPVRPPEARVERFHLRDALAAMDVRAWQATLARYGTRSQP